MQVKLNTYNWCIQWNSVVMLVKKTTFRRMGSGGKGRTENRWYVSGARRSAPPEVYLIFHQEESAADHRSDICSISEISI